MDWVNKHIAIGNFADVQDLSAGSVDAVLCLKANCCDETDERFDVLCVPLDDGPGNSSRWIEHAVNFININVSGGRRILVHCHAGRSRSVYVVARYLCLYGYLSFEQALACIARVRSVHLTPGIEELLDA